MTPVTGVHFWEALYQVNNLYHLHLNRGYMWNKIILK